MKRSNLLSFLVLPLVILQTLTGCQNKYDNTKLNIKFSIATNVSNNTTITQTYTAPISLSDTASDVNYAINKFKYLANYIQSYTLLIRDEEFEKEKGIDNVIQTTLTNYEIRTSTQDNYYSKPLFFITDKKTYSEKIVDNKLYIAQEEYPVLLTFKNNKLESKLSYSFTDNSKNLPFTSHTELEKYILNNYENESNNFNNYPYVLFNSGYQTFNSQTYLNYSNINLNTSSQTNNTPLFMSLGLSCTVNNSDYTFKRNSASNMYKYDDVNILFVDLTDKKVKYFVNEELLPNYVTSTNIPLIFVDVSLNKYVINDTKPSLTLSENYKIFLDCFCSYYKEEVGFSLFESSDKITFVSKKKNEDPKEENFIRNSYDYSSYYNIINSTFKK